MKIAIDQGHSFNSKDGGALGILSETVCNTEIGEILQKYLEDDGHDVVMVRPTKASSVLNSLYQRVDKANDSNCDLYISIHHNAFNGKAHGTETYCYPGSAKGRKLASAVQRHLVKDLDTRDRGVKSHPKFYVVRKTSMPAILVEVCFIDNQGDCSKWNAVKAASAILKGVREYLK